MYNVMYMATMVRKQVYLERRQDQALKRLARRTGKTEAAIIREALDRHAEEADREKARLRLWQDEKAFIDQWMAKGPVPAGGRTWKREDLYDRFERSRLGRR